MFEESIVIVFLSIHSIFAPNLDNISHDIFTSLILGKFSIVHLPFISKAAGSMATAAFFAH